MGGKPLREGLQFRVKSVGRFDIAGCAEVRVELLLELKHIAQVFRAGEAEGAVEVRSFFALKKRRIFSGSPLSFA